MTIKNNSYMRPIILVAPHGQSNIESNKIRKRLLLSDFEIWKCSDPYTNLLNVFTCAQIKHSAKTHRIICDFNRAPEPHEATHTKDFFGHKVFKKGHYFTQKEKRLFIDNLWWPFHQKIIKSIKKLDKAGHKKILLIDYHNTSGDHPLNKNKEYMPSLVISNLGRPITGKKRYPQQKLALSAELMAIFQKSLKSHLNLGAEINGVFKGGFNLQWYSKLEKELKTNASIYAVQIEYNLDLVVNPLSKRVDKKALHILQTGINKAIEELFDVLKQPQRKIYIGLPQTHKIIERSQ